MGARRVSSGAHVRCPMSNVRSLASHLPPLGRVMSSFSTYVIGFVILVAGLAMAAYLLDVPTIWIAVGIIVALGIGVISATSRTKTKDPPAH